MNYRDRATEQEIHRLLVELELLAKKDRALIQELEANRLAIKHLREQVESLYMIAEGRVELVAANRKIETAQHLIDKSAQELRDNPTRQRPAVSDLPNRSR